jgi:hypothetical protein
MSEIWAQGGRHSRQDTTHTTTGWRVEREGKCRAEVPRRYIYIYYQTSQRTESSRTIGEPALQPKAWAKAGIFESGPITRYFAMA